jgi:hypothetical protein
MILVVAVIAGVIAGLIRAKIGKRPYQPYQMSGIWLVLIALIIQWLAFSFSPTRDNLPDWLVSASLVLSQTTLLIFAWLNRKVPGFWLLGIGLILNLAVIVANKGFMPISPETVQWLHPDVPASSWVIGQRLGTGKDIILPVDKTVLYFLSDRFRTPNLEAYRVAFSAGDVVVALGAFWLLWAIGGPVYSESKQEV